MTSTGDAIVVEGYTDVIALHEAGFTNVVATLGTSLTRQHIRLLSHHAKSEIMAGLWAQRLRNSRSGEM